MKSIFRSIIMVAVAIIVFGAFAKAAFADTAHNTSGFAWSKNIGWVSFNCTDTGGCLTADEDEGGVGEDLGFGPTQSDYAFLRDYIENTSSSSSSGSLSYERKGIRDLLGFAGSFFTVKRAMADVVIAYDGSNYGVNVDPDTGVMSGYAWSSEVGWISFNEVGCPYDAGCTPVVDLDDGDVTGFARALSHGDDWDGWISLSCANAGLGGCWALFGGSDYGVNLDLMTGVFSGYAWGDEVVGWLKFSGPTYQVIVDLDQPQATISASAASTCTENVTLSWETIGMTSCTLSSSDGIIVDEAVTVPLGSTDVFPSANPTTYTLTCAGDDGETYTASTSVAIECTPLDGELVLQATPSPVSAATGYKTNLTWFSPSSTIFSYCDGQSFQSLIPPIITPPPPQAFDTASLSGLNPANSYTSTMTNVNVTLNPTHFKITCYKAADGTPVEATTSVARAMLNPTCSFTEASLVDGGVELSWVTTSGTSATASASPAIAGWSGGKPLSGSATVGFASPETEYSLTVTATDGSTSTCTAAVNTSCTDIDPNDPNGTDPDAPTTVSLVATPTVLPGTGGNVTLSWTTENAIGGEALSSPTSSWGPVDCSDGGGSEVVTIDDSTTFVLRCAPLYCGDDVSDYAYVGVGEAPCDPEVDDCPVLCTEDSDSPECEGIPPIIIER